MPLPSRHLMLEIVISPGAHIERVPPPQGQIAAAIEELRAGLRDRLPALAARVSRWMDDISPNGQAARYFAHPQMFPMLQLPSWLAGTICDERDTAFHAGLVYSTANGYYYIRLLDNLMDGHATVERELLPAATFFHTEFCVVYQRYFGPYHPFWRMFTRFWLACSESVAKEAALDSMRFQDFAEISAGKFAAAKIPLSAVACRYRRPDVLPLWLQFCDALACWTQMLDDLFDWYDDLERKGCTYLLSEAVRRKSGNESVEAWMMREGFSWGVRCLRDQMLEVRRLAHKLRCPALVEYLEKREGIVQAEVTEISKGLGSLKELAAVLEWFEGDSRRRSKYDL